MTLKAILYVFTEFFIVFFFMSFYVVCKNECFVQAVPTQPLDETVAVEMSVNYSTPAGRTRPMEYRYEFINKNMLHYV